MNVDKYSMKQFKLALELSKALNLCICHGDCKMCVLYGNRECPEHFINSLTEAIKLKDEQLKQLDKELNNETF